MFADELPSPLPRDWSGNLPDVTQLATAPLVPLEYLRHMTAGQTRRLDYHQHEATAHRLECSALEQELETLGSRAHLLLRELSQVRLRFGQLRSRYQDEAAAALQHERAMEALALHIQRTTNPPAHDGLHSGLQGGQGVSE